MVIVAPESISIRHSQPFITPGMYNPKAGCLYAFLSQTFVGMRACLRLRDRLLCPCRQVSFLWVFRRCTGKVCACAVDVLTPMETVVDVRAVSCLRFLLPATENATEHLEN